MKTKGIFCLEGQWQEDLRKKNTVRPILELLELNANVPYIYHDCATIAEFEFFLKKWRLAKYTKYPILYLAFHGGENGIWISDDFINLTKIGELLKNKCKNRIIVLASCSTVNIQKSRMEIFLEKTQALAVCGYRLIVPWITATAFELMLLSTLQENTFDGRGIKAIYRKVDHISKMFRDLRFKIFANFINSSSKY